nr:hypothetical protein [Pedobacter panaciterrae]
MRYLFLKTIVVLLFFVGNSNISKAQQIPSAQLQSNPWTKDQLMEPSVLAKMIEKGQKIRIYNIGVVEDIKGATHLGAASEKLNVEKLSKALKGLPKDEMIVVYCGCCPMDKCPNIRPAFKALNDQKFTKAYLLNLTVNLKTEWINKGYPLAQTVK